MRHVIRVIAEHCYSPETSRMHKLLTSVLANHLGSEVCILQLPHMKRIIPFYISQIILHFRKTSSILLLPRLILDISKLFLEIVISLSSYYFYIVFSGHSIIAYRYKSTLLGDLIYDDILCRQKIATVKSATFFQHFLSTAVIHIRFIILSKLFTILDPDYLLAGHRVGALGGILSACSETYGIPHISYGGNYPSINITCALLRKTYEYSPTAQDLRRLDGLGDVRLLNDFARLSSFIGTDRLNLDSKRAFSGDIQTSRQAFFQKLGINYSSDRKVCFVMLHAFTDHPHSHFNTKMVFDDFYDWYLATLEIAKSTPDIIFVFKEHPSSHLYKTIDYSFDADKQKYNDVDNVIFLPSAYNFNSSSLATLCDLIVTCSGSAGFEFSALYGIRTLVAAETPYTSFSHCLRAISRGQYFHMITEKSNYQPLKDNEKLEAIKAFNFIYSYSKVTMSTQLNVLQDALVKHFHSEPISQSSVRKDVDFLLSSITYTTTDPHCFSTRSF